MHDDVVKAIFRFVKLEGKKRIGKKVYSQEQVLAPDFKYDYGRIVPSGYVVFDFDKQPYINIISNIIEMSTLKCRKLTTTKGVHFMFRTNKEKVSDKIKTYNFIGLQCDIKACGTEENKQSYQAIRVNGEMRKEEFIHCSSDDELDYAPKWLYDVKKKDYMDLTIDQTGNRNNLFFKELKVKAKRYGFTYDEYVEIAHIINNFILPNPIDENELNNAIRIEAWENLEISEDEKKMFLLDMAKDVIEHWNCKIFNGNLIFFDENLEHYSNNENTIFCYIQEKYAYQNITKGRMNEVVEQMNIQLNHYEKYKCERNPEYIVCRNKLVSMWRNDIKDMTRTIVTDIFYPYEIMTEEELKNYNGIGKKFLEDISCNDLEMEKVICECLGCMLAPENRFGKIFVWYGNGNNGKSVLIKVMEKIMGNFLTGANILKINDKYALSRAYKGIANVTDDVGVTILRETGILKSIIDGSEIEIERKYYDPISWKPISQFVMCCNELPKIQDNSKGMLRRLAFIPFELQLKENEIDRDLVNKLYGISPKLNDDEKNDNALRYIMTKAILAYREAYNRDKLTELEKQKELLNDFKEENKDSIVLFYDYLLERENGIDNFLKWIDGKTREEILKEYKEFADIEIKKENECSFFIRFNRLLPSKVKKKNVRVSGLLTKKYYLD